MTAALALDYFARSKVDIAIVETGLGGRLDASNVLSPLLTITTDIGLDHIEILGDSIEAIAGEKAGIIKQSVPHLMGLLPEPARGVIARVCKEKKAPLYRLYKRDFKPKSGAMSLDFQSNGLALRSVRPSLIGPHQMVNAAVALKAVAVLKDRYRHPLSTKVIRRGLGSINWPGRFQVIEQPDKPTLVLDVCHNLGSVTAFTETFRLRFPGRKARIIIGFVKRKPHQAMFDVLSEIAASHYVVPLQTKRSIDIKELMGELNWRGVPHQRFGSLRAAYNKLSKESGADDIIGIIGSHYLVGEFLKNYG